MNKENIPMYVVYCDYTDIYDHAHTKEEAISQAKELFIEASNDMDEDETMDLKVDIYKLDSELIGKVITNFEVKEIKDNEEKTI